MTNNKPNDVRVSRELLPCPYCGRTARYVAEDYVDNSGEPWPFAECDACNTGAPVEFWNKRAQPADKLGEPFAFTTTGMLAIAEDIQKHEYGVGRIGARLDRTERFCIPLYLHAQPATVKVDERLTEAAAFVQKLCDAARGQPSFATGYLSDILDVLQGRSKLNTPQ